MQYPFFVRLAFFTSLFALAVMMLGAYVRLSDAGLGCPDWPGCYGRLGAPTSSHEVESATAAFPERPVDSSKAWKEMAHRYFAGTLGLLVLGIGLIAWKRRKIPGQMLALPLVLIGLVIFQALLGMWTVTLLVKPAVVTAHLLGGLFTVGLLWWLTLRQSGWLAGPPPPELSGLRSWVWLGIGVLLVQIFLGGWTSTNYAALGCTEFPRCYGGSWWPATDFSQAFVLWRQVGVNYEFGVLDSAARTAIHLTHRIGAMVTLIFLGTLAWRLIRSGDRRVGRPLGAVLAVVLGLQIALGITNVIAQLPLPVAVSHNGVAAVLFMVLLTLLHSLTPGKGSSSTPGTVQASTEK